MMRFAKPFGVILAGLLASASAAAHAAEAVQPVETAAVAPSPAAATAKQAGPAMHDFAGTYLASHYAQSRNDWKRASVLLDQILKRDPDNKELLRQSMVLAEGSGYHDLSAERATQMLQKDPNDPLSHLILATHGIAKGNYDDALKTLAAMPKNDMTDFIRPLLEGWALAGKDEFKPELLKGTTIHAYHGALIARYLKEKPDVVFGFAETILAPSGLTGEEVERAADLMAVSGHGKDALNVYKALQSQNGGSPNLARKIAMVSKGEDITPLVPAFTIKTPAEGAAFAILDLARILYQQDSDSSARVFAQMALDLNPNMTMARILIASSHARDGQIDEAIRQYNAIPESDPEYLASQQEAADLLAQAGRMDEAVAQLNKLYESHHNLDSLIRIGDLYRADNQFQKALDVYQKAAATLPNPIPAENWYLLYVRGMAEERLGNWPAAEKDLKEALADQPNQPYIMNYLGYAWADRGEHPDESLKMLEKASSLRPNDGYITDSLGWAHYKLGQYKEAVPLLEQAVGLLPYDPEINDHLGDAYWQVGRSVEAQFQWERARNYSKDPKLTDKIVAKIAHGLPDQPASEQAKGAATEAPSPDAGPAANVTPGTPPAPVSR